MNNHEQQTPPAENSQPLSGDTAETQPMTPAPDDGEHKGEHHHRHKEKKVHIAEHELRILEAKAQELAEMRDTLLRRAADFENAKKRLQRDKDDAVKYANEKLIAAFLPILDNLTRALTAAAGTKDAAALTTGVELVKKQIDEVLKSYGLMKIDAVGKPFDPHIHEAVGAVEGHEVEVDTVIEEVQCGYLLKDKLLRPSWVRIAHGKHAPDVPHDDGQPTTQSQE